jgi:hypothetical protein
MTDISCYPQAAEAPVPAESDLESIFGAVGKEHGFDDVSAQYSKYKEFKSTWQLCGTTINFQVSDYLKGAEPMLLRDFAGSLYTKINRRTVHAQYSDRLRAWLQSDEFVRLNQQTYVKRSRNLSRSAQGKHYDLKETYRSLQDQGLAWDWDSASLNWTKSGNRFRVGYCSVLMQVVAISSLLDNEKVPEHVHEYVLYHELLHLEDGMGNGGRHHPKSFLNRERLYPRWEESEQWLKRLAARKVDLN